MSISMPSLMRQVLQPAQILPGQVGRFGNYPYVPQAPSLWLHEEDLLENDAASLAIKSQDKHTEQV